MASVRMESCRRLLDAVKFTPDQSHTVLQVLQATVHWNRRLLAKSSHMSQLLS